MREPQYSVSGSVTRYCALESFSRSHSSADCPAMGLIGFGFSPETLNLPVVKENQMGH